MPTLNVRILDAQRMPLDDQVDIDVTRLRTNELVARVRNHDGRKKLSIRDLTAGETYVVRAFPMRHRPVGSLPTSRWATSRRTCRCMPRCTLSAWVTWISPSTRT